jgi:hypothetical protein
MESSFFGRLKGLKCKKKEVEILLKISLGHLSCKKYFILPYTVYTSKKLIPEK